ncbi:hypothetical protein [Primorskyibacter flagellatus]
MQITGQFANPLAVVQIIDRISADHGSGHHAGLSGIVARWNPGARERI